MSATVSSRLAGLRRGGGSPSAMPPVRAADSTPAAWRAARTAAVKLPEEPPELPGPEPGTGCRSRRTPRIHPDLRARNKDRGPPRRQIADDFRAAWRSSSRRWPPIRAGRPVVLENALRRLRLVHHQPLRHDPSGKGAWPVEQIVERAAEAVDIGPAVDVVTIQRLFGATLIGRSEHVFIVGHGQRIRDFRPRSEPVPCRES